MPEQGGSGFQKLHVAQEGELAASCFPVLCQETSKHLPASCGRAGTALTFAVLALSRAPHRGRLLRGTRAESWLAESGQAGCQGSAASSSAALLPSNQQHTGLYNRLHLRPSAQLTQWVGLEGTLKVTQCQALIPDGAFVPRLLKGEATTKIQLELHFLNKYSSFKDWNSGAALWAETRMAE